MSDRLMTILAALPHLDLAERHALRAALDEPAPAYVENALVERLAEEGLLQRSDRQFSEGPRPTARFLAADAALAGDGLILVGPLAADALTTRHSALADHIELFQPPSCRLALIRRLERRHGLSAELAAELALVLQLRSRWRQVWLPGPLLVTSDPRLRLAAAIEGVGVQP